MKKYRIISILFLMMFIVAFSFTALADETNGMGATKATDLNIRSLPTTDSEVIGHLYYGDKINIITKTGDWYKVLINGSIGYVHSDFINASRSGEPVVYSQTVTSYQSDEGASKGQQVVNIAKSYLGVPYVWAGTSPDGFDCSGLVQYVYKQMGVSLNRVAADQTAHGTPVDRENLKPGDIVFFHNTSKYTRINHVGIYVGDGNFIHAPQTGDVVKISSLDTDYYRSTFVTARRIFD